MELTYTNEADRLVKIKEAEDQGLVMLHDNFTATGGVLIFELPEPPTAEELIVEAVEQETQEANDQALVAYQNFDNLTLAQKSRVLKMLLGDFISRNRSNYM